MVGIGGNARFRPPGKLAAMAIIPGQQGWREVVDVAPGHPQLVTLQNCNCTSVTRKAIMLATIALFIYTTGKMG